MSAATAQPGASISSYSGLTRSGVRRPVRDADLGGRAFGGVPPTLHLVAYCGTKEAAKANAARRRQYEYVRHLAIRRGPDHRLGETGETTRGRSTTRPE